MNVPTHPAADRAIRAGIVALVLLICGFVSWAGFIPISGAVVATGQVDVEKSRQVVQHPEGGRIAAVLVSEGQEVRAGQDLVRLDSRTDEAALALAEGQMARAMAEKARLLAERDGGAQLALVPGLAALIAQKPDLFSLVLEQESLLQSRRDSLTDELATLAAQERQAGAEIAGLDIQAAASTRQMTMLTVELRRQSGLLAKGLAQVAHVTDLQREIARLDGAMGGLQAARAQAEEHGSAARLQAQQLNRSLREDAIARLRDIAAALDQLADRCTQSRARIAAATLRAPLDGRVLNLAFTSASAVVRPAEPILFIMPSRRPLVVEVRIAPTDVDQVRPGQTATVRIAAYDSRSTPDMAGRVVGLSADALTDSNRSQSFYRAEIEFDPSGSTAASPPLRLVPGMPVEVFLRTTDRTALSLLTEPLMLYFRHAFRAG